MVWAVTGVRVHLERQRVPAPRGVPGARAVPEVPVAWVAQGASAAQRAMAVVVAVAAGAAGDQMAASQPLWVRRGQLAAWVAVAVMLVPAAHRDPQTVVQLASTELLAVAEPGGRVGAVQRVVWASQEEESVRVAPVAPVAQAAWEVAVQADTTATVAVGAPAA